MPHSVQPARTTSREYPLHSTKQPPSTVRLGARAAVLAAALCREPGWVGGRPGQIMILRPDLACPAPFSSPDGAKASAFRTPAGFDPGC